MTGEPVAFDATPDDELAAWNPDQLDWLVRRMRCNHPDLCKVFDAAALVHDFVFNPGFHRIPWAGVLTLAVDSGFEFGCKAVVVALQGLVGAIPDGILGDETAKRLTMVDPDHLYLALLRWRLEQRPEFVNDYLTLSYFDRYIAEHHGDVNRPFGQEPGFVGG